MKQRTPKKRRLRRPVAVLLAGVLAVSLLPAALAAPAAEHVDDVTEIIASAKLQSDPFDFEDYTSARRLAAEAQSFPASFDLRHCDTDGDGVYECYVTPVKLQNPFGTCWGFGATAAAEISLLGSGLAQADGYGAVADPENGIKELNLSEKHLAYFTFTALNDRNDSQDGEGLTYPAGTTASERFNTGGMTFFATELYASGIGPNLEDRSGLNAGDEDILVYQGENGYVEFQMADVDDNGTFELTPVWYSEYDDWSLPESYRFYASYRLQDSFELPSPATRDEEDNYVYNEDGTNAIKEQLLAKRGVTIAFHADSSIPGKDPEGDTYISENWAHYTWDNSSINHGVCIVGWDDNYPKENFVAGHQPPENGAWLVKNSWGSALNSDFYGNGYRDWGIRDENGKATGYFWLSYYDQSLSCPEAFVFDKSNVGHSYYVEQHDYLPVNSISEVTVDREVGMANVFCAEGDSVLSELSFQTATPGTTVTYEVYLLDEGFDNPVKGTPVISGTVTYPYGGYHKVTLSQSQQVEMKAGQLFSVAVKEQTPSGDWAYIMPLAFSGEALAMMGVPQTPKAIINEKESFFFTDSAWHDMSDKKLVDKLLLEDDEYAEELNAMQGMLEVHCDNFPIKAYLEPVGTVSENDIDPDPQRNQEPSYDGTLKIEIGNDQVLYPDTKTFVGVRIFGSIDAITDPNQSVTWTSSDPSVFTVGPGIDANNSGKKSIQAVGLGTATLTADIGPYGKQTVTVTVKQRTFELILLNAATPVYTGEPIEPKVLLAAVSRMPDEPFITAEEGKDYRIEYKDNVLCGTAQATLIGMGDYAGVEQTKEFTIVPARPEITDATFQDGTLTLQFVSQAESGIDGYELAWCPVGAPEEEVQTVKLAPDATSAEITGLEAGEIYSASLRAYIDPDEETKAEAEAYGIEADPTYGQACIPVIVSACAKDDSCPMDAYSDISPDAWYHDGVHWALEQGVMNGIGENTFDPGGTATRAMIVTMLWRLAGQPQSESPAAFTDVESGAWYAEAVNWAAENGIVKGYSDTVFGPNDNVTREQLAVILYRCSNGGIESAEMIAIVNVLVSLMGMDINIEDLMPQQEPLPFDDADSVSEWAEDGVYWAWENGILNGKTETLLAPQGNATRAEVATMFMRVSAIVFQ